MERIVPTENDGTGFALAPTAKGDCEITLVQNFERIVMYIGGGILGTLLVVLLILYLARRI